MENLKARELYINNCKAVFNGYNNGLTAEWMAIMSNVSISTIYRQIKKGRALTNTELTIKL